MIFYPCENLRFYIFYKLHLNPTDKKGGIAVLNTTDYIDSIKGILNATHTDQDGTVHKYFQPLDPNVTEQMLSNDLDDLNKEVQNGHGEGLDR